jgi:DNA polymerase-3 subunit alpha
MAFLLLEDESGFFEVITFPAVYQKYSNLFRKEAPLLIEGVLSKNSGDSKIIARKIVNINSYLVSRESYLVKKKEARSQEPEY